MNSKTNWAQAAQEINQPQLAGLCNQNWAALEILIAQETWA